MRIESLGVRPVGPAAYQRERLPGKLTIGGPF